MRYTKNGHTINNAPAFEEKEMLMALVALYKSDIISDKAKEILKKGIK